jgi:hypothetical protein
MDFESSDQISLEIRKLRGDEQDFFNKWVHKRLKRIERARKELESAINDGYNNDERIE